MTDTNLPEGWTDDKIAEMEAWQASGPKPPPHPCPKCGADLWEQEKRMPTWRCLICDHRAGGVMTNTSRMVYQTDAYNGEFVGIREVIQTHLLPKIHARTFVRIDSGTRGHSTTIRIPPESVSPLIAALIEMCPEWRELAAKLPAMVRFLGHELMPGLPDGWDNQVDSIADDLDRMHALLTGGADETSIHD